MGKKQSTTEEVEVASDEVDEIDDKEQLEELDSIERTEGEGENEDENEDESVEELEDKVITFKDEIELLKDQLQRERAEFTNYRKRAIQEKEELLDFSVGQVLGKLLPTLDSFDQLFASNKEKNYSEKDFKSLVTGVELINKQIVEAFNSFNVEEYAPLDEPFDPAKMEAIAVLEDESVDQEKVAQVYQKGFKIKDRVIRAARVQVVKPTVKKEVKEEKIVEDEQKENLEKEVASPEE